jgi:NTE family protein
LFESGNSGQPKTAFVFAGGGSFGAVQVGMMQSLASHGVGADMVVGSSVGAINGAFYAGDPTVDGVKRLAGIWRGLKRHDVFPVSLRTLIGFLWRRDFLIPHDGIRKLVLSDGPTADAIVASTAIPGAFSPIHYKDYYLADGAVSSNTPVRIAVKKGAKRLIILPTGHACANQAPPVGAVANALHALTLLISRQMVDELENLGPDIEYYVVPPLCPLVGSPYDFSRTAEHISRAIDTTDAWLADKGLQQSEIPHELRPHDH